MLLLDLSNCGPSGLLRVLYFIKLILDIIFIIIPIGLIILITIDFAKAVISGDESAQSKAFKLSIKRILYALFVFFVPTIVSIVNIILGDLGVNYSVCYNDISLDAINALEAEEIAIEEARSAAKLALIEKQRQEEKEKNNVGEYSTITGKGCDGLVYYDNGIFYKPSSKYSNGTAETKGSSLYGYNKYFYEMLNSMITDAKQNGYTITIDKGVNAWRPIEAQIYYACCDSNDHPELKKYDAENYYKFDSKRICKGSGTCNSGNTAATVGTSNHGWGIASDLDYNNIDAEKWAHKNAYKYGLKFSVCNSYPNDCKEPWHIAPSIVKTDDSVVSKCG